MDHYTIAILDAHAGAAFVTQRGLEWGLGDSASILPTNAPAAAWELCTAKLVNLLIADPTGYGEAGWTLLRVLRDMCPSLPIMMLAADCTPPVRRRAGTLGILCMPKTHEMNEICAAARALLEPTGQQCAGAMPA